MINLVIAFGAGLIVGWNLLPQPAIVKDMYTKIVDLIKSAFGG